MLKLQVLVTALLGAVTAAATNITYHGHFATEELNRAAPFYDLTPWGYHGGQLPKVYSVSQNGSDLLTYHPQLSHAEFQKIISGTANATSDFSASQKALLSTGGKRSTYDSLTMTLRNKAGGADQYAIQADKSCHAGSHVPWHYAVVHYIQDAYITFWASSACNGDKGSFNPVCDWYDEPAESCVFNFSPKSFRAYSGCHNSYGMGKGCSHTST